jgi:hypothetical protein
MPEQLLRRDVRRRRSRPKGTSRFTPIIVGVVVGFAAVIYLNWPGAGRTNPDALKIWRIASGQRPDFTDRSFTPVARIYEAVGLGDAPVAAGIVGFLLGAALITFVLLRHQSARVSWLTAGYALAGYLLTAFHLGQYSKDVFLIPVILILLVNRRIWWELVALASMMVYAYLFRDYWYLVAAGYLVYRILTWSQARIRYLVLLGGLGSIAVGMGIHRVYGRDPQDFRTRSIGYYEPSTALPHIVPFPQPVGGLVDIFANYWLLFLPVTLPVTAGAIYIVVTLAVAGLRLYPLACMRSSRRWPERSTLDGVVVRRTLSLLLSYTVVQAAFEPDYGSVLRHVTPLIALAVAGVLAMESGQRREGKAAPWNWSGAARHTGNTR